MLNLGASLARGAAGGEQAATPATPAKAPRKQRCLADGTRGPASHGVTRL